MERMKYYWNRSWSWLLSTLLTMFGFAACNEEYVEPMYGTPYVDFSIKGKVENVRGDALAGIRVVILRDGYLDWVESDTVVSDTVVIREMCDTLYTSSDGRFTWQRGWWPRDTMQCELRFNDVEKEQYEADTIRIVFLPEEYYQNKTGEVWNIGSAKREITVILQEKHGEY